MSEQREDVDTSEADGEDVADQTWLRRNRVWLIGSLFLGAVAFIYPYRHVMSELDKRQPRHAVLATNDGWVSYEGARWRVTGAELDPEAGRAVADYPHEAADLLFVHYEVVTDKKADVERLGNCKGRLSAADGRVWDANEPYRILQRMRSRGFYPGCGSYLTREGEVRAESGKPFAFTHAFVLPPGTSLKDATVDIYLPAISTTPPGRYARFALPVTR